MLLPVQFQAQQTTTVRVLRLVKLIKKNAIEYDIGRTLLIDRIVDVLIESADRLDARRFEVLLKRQVKSHRLERFQIDVSCLSVKIV